MNAQPVPRGKREERFKWCYVITCSVFVASGGIPNGYDIGSSNGVKEMEGFREYFNLSSTEGNSTCRANDDEETSTLLGLVVSMFALGSLLGGLLGGPLSDWAGRRAALLTGALLCATGIIVQTSSVFIWMLLIGKFWTGLGSGMATQYAAVYIAEISPKHIRGKLVSMTPTAAGMGNLSGALVNLGAKNLSFGWRIAFGVQLLVVTAFIMGTPFIPESPRWLVKRNKSLKATKVLKRIYKNDDTVSSCLEEISTSFQKSHRSKSFWSACCTRDIFFRIFLGLSMLAFTRVNGLQLALYFSASMFCKVGISGFVGGVLMGVAVLTGQLSQLFIADKFGRKVVFLVGYLVMTVCLVAASILILVFDLESDTLSTENTVAGYFVVVFLMLFVAVGVISASHAWIVNSEIFPLRVKGVAVAVSSVGWWGGNIISGLLSPFLLASLGTAGTLLFHSGVCVLIFFFVLLLLPETKNLSLEKVDLLFSAPWTQRTNVIFYLRCGRTARSRKVLFHTREDTELFDISLNNTSESPAIESPNI